MKALYPKALSPNRECKKVHRQTNGPINFPTDGRQTKEIPNFTCLLTYSLTELTLIQQNLE